MKKRKIEKNFLIIFICLFICLLFSGMLTFLQNHMMRNLVDQEMASRWSDKKDAAQISVFFANDSVEGASYFQGIAVAIDDALKAASLTGETKEKDKEKEIKDGEQTEEEISDAAPSGRLWMSALSRQGKAVLKSGSKTAEADVVGVEGDFFQFHPLYLLGGTYFSTENPMKDGVILDKETAWQLFGSSNVAGMEITIGEIPHIVIGVYEKPQGRLWEAAGLNKPMCFLSLESLEKYGTSLQGYNYDLVLPNPIKDFGVTIVKNVFASQERSIQVVDNSVRYDILPLFNIILNFGTRSMSHHQIIYPYWENVARGYEDIFALLLLFKSVFWTLGAVLLAIVIISWYKNKNWTMKDVIDRLKDKYYEWGSKRMEKKREKERKKEEEKDEKI